MSGIHYIRNQASLSEASVNYVTAHLAAIVLLGCPCYLASPGPDPQPSANDLMKDVVANELTDRKEHSNWMYRVTRGVDQRTLAQIEVETKDGPVYRLLRINATRLDSAQQEQETLRQEQLIRDPNRQLKVKQQNEADELRLEILVRLLPSAFLFEYDGWDGSDMRLRFRPDPSFVASTM